MFTIIQYGRLNPTKIWHICPVVTASILHTFRENIEIPRKQANSAARLKIPWKTGAQTASLSHSSVTLRSVLISVYMVLSRQWAADTAQLCGW